MKVVPSIQCLLNTFIVTKTILILKLIYIEFFLFFVLSLLFSVTCFSVIGTLVSYQSS